MLVIRKLEVREAVVDDTHILSTVHDGHKNNITLNAMTKSYVLSHLSKIILSRSGVSLYMKPKLCALFQ